MSRGFDSFYGFIGGSRTYFAMEQQRPWYSLMRDRSFVDEEEGFYVTSALGSEGAAFIDAHAEEPFFLYLSYNAPHTPIQSPADWFEKVKKREEGISNQRAKLVALIEHMDHGIGKVMSKLDETGLAEKTFVIFVSDNGGQANVGASNGALRGEKQEMYEGGLRVPACAVWPGRIRAGGRNNFVAATMDIFPTVAGAAGAKIAHAIDGRSFLPLLLGEDQPAFDRDLFFTRREGGERYMGECIWAMRRGNWKLVKNTPMTPWELFDLAKDPGETTDLSKGNRRKFRELAGAMRVHIQRGGAVPWQKSKR